MRVFICLSSLIAQESAFLLQEPDVPQTLLKSPPSSWSTLLTTIEWSASLLATIKLDRYCGSALMLQYCYLLCPRHHRFYLLNVTQDQSHHFGMERFGVSCVYFSSLFRSLWSPCILSLCLKVWWLVCVSPKRCVALPTHSYRYSHSFITHLPK